MQEIAAKFVLACEQALLFGRAKRASRERRSLARSRVLARLASLAQIGELARGLSMFIRSKQDDDYFKSLAKSTFRVSKRFTSLLFPVRTSTVATEYLKKERCLLLPRLLLLPIICSYRLNYDKFFIFCCLQ